MEGKLYLKENLVITHYSFYSCILMRIDHTIATVYFQNFKGEGLKGSAGRDNNKGPLPKKPKSQRSRIYRRKVKCRECDAQMNSDNFLKHNTSKHNGRAKSQDVVEASQKMLNFATVI
jgi:hypothetical protein